jgi:hypothetical protein
MNGTVKDLRLVARGFERERVTSAQAKSIIPLLIRAADEIESMEKELENDRRSHT